MMLAGLLQGHCPKVFWQTPLGYSSLLPGILTHTYLQTAAVHACQQCTASQAKLLASVCVSAHKYSAPTVYHQPCDVCKPYIHSMKDVHSFAPKAHSIKSNNISQCTAVVNVVQLPIVYASATAVNCMNDHCSDVEASLYGAQRLVNAWSRCTHALTSLQWLASPHTWEGRYEQSFICSNCSDLTGAVYQTYLTISVIFLLEQRLIAAFYAAGMKTSFLTA